MVKLKGFTLTELLICLAILGEIATFTIPKILLAQQNKTYNAIAKEAVATIVTAHQQLQLNGALNANTYAKDLAPYFNYASIDTSGSLIDDRPYGAGSLSCDANKPCLKLHNGATLQPYSEYFNGTSSLNAVAFTIDPDGTYTGNSDSLKVLLYYNGRIVDRQNCMTGTLNSGGGCNPLPNVNPSWFSW